MTRRQKYLVARAEDGADRWLYPRYRGTDQLAFDCGGILTRSAGYRLTSAICLGAQQAAGAAIVIGVCLWIPMTRGRIERLKGRQNLLVPIAMAAYLPVVRLKTACLYPN